MYIYIYIYISEQHPLGLQFCLCCALLLVCKVPLSPPPLIDHKIIFLNITEVSQDPLPPPPAGRAVAMVCFFRPNPGEFSLSRGVQWAHALIGACVRMSALFRTFTVKCFTEKHSFSLLAREDTLYALTGARRA